ncbi:MAG: PIN domain-containing protein, partial [Actinomycetales bacterium]
MSRRVAGYPGKQRIASQVAPGCEEVSPAVAPTRKTYVLDTSVLLSDPRALRRFDEHDVVIPVVVIIELEAKRSHPELGYFARQALRILDDLRVLHGRLDAPMPVGEGTVRVELNHADVSVLPHGFPLGENDSRILAVAQNLRAEGSDVVLVSKDLPMRVKASAVGLVAEEYRAELVLETGYTGVREVDVADADIDRLFEESEIDLDLARQMPCHMGLVLTGNRQHALGRVTPEKRVRLVRGDREVFGIHGRS